MQSTSSIHNETVADVLREVLTSTADSFLVTPSQELLRTCVTVLDDIEGPTVRVLAPESVLKEIRKDFVVASTAADLVAAGRLTLRTDDAVENTLVVTADAVVAVVTTGDRVAGLATEDEGFAASANDYYGDQWAAADDFALRTPAISAVRDTLESEFGPEVAADFDGVLAAGETARGDGDGLDEVTISLLVAARHEQLLYDVSKWGEDVGLASKATFSRTKTRLEDAGLVDTEKVPLDVGRPRLRLLPGDDRLREADAADLATTAQSILASHAS